MSERLGGWWVQAKMLTLLMLGSGVSDKMLTLLTLGSGGVGKVRA